MKFSAATMFVLVNGIAALPWSLGGTSKHTGALAANEDITLVLDTLSSVVLLFPCPPSLITIHNLREFLREFLPFRDEQPRTKSC